MKREELLEKLEDYKQDYKISLDEVDLTQFNELKALVIKMHSLFGASKTTEMLQTNRKNLYNIRHSDFVKIKVGNYRKLHSLAILALSQAELHVGMALTTKRKIEMAKGKGLTLTMQEIMDSTSIEPHTIETEYDGLIMLTLSDDVSKFLEEDDEDEMP